MPEIPTIVSVDDHVIEPPTCGPTDCPRSTSTSARGSSTVRSRAVVRRRRAHVGGRRARRRGRHGVVVVLRRSPLPDGAHAQRGEVPARPDSR